MLFPKQKEIIGLDIGSSLIKAIQLREGPKGFHLEKFGIAPLQPEIIVDGTIIDASRLVEAIRLLCKEQKIKTKNVAISVSGHASVIIKRITIPEMSEEELSESIRWEAEQYVPFSIDEVELDFQILSPGKTGSGQMEVLLVAVKKDKINDVVTVTTEAGLAPVIVDVDAFAIENMYEINYEPEIGRNIALVNIGASTINMNIVRDGISLFTRDTSMGGNQVTEAIQKEFGLSFEDAERAKKGEEVPGVSITEVGSIIDGISGDIASEISRSFDFFKSTQVGEEVAKVVLSGGCAKLKDLSNLLSEKLGAIVEVANPFKNISIDPKAFDTDYLLNIAPMTAVAVGLAIRRIGDR
jgi:type IV pilus assembly protein PilM